MKSGILLVLLLVMVAALGCEKKETMSFTAPSGKKASVSFNK